jgi:predicted AAA+ superfamily ATPase
VKAFKKNDVLQISGPSKSGKTHLVVEFLKEMPFDDVLFLSGNSMLDKIVLMNNDSLELAQLIKNRRVILIDDAHRIPRLDSTLKTLRELSSTLKIVTIYSTRAIDDRKQLRIYPIGFNAISAMFPSTPDIDLLNESLVYGSLPEILAAPSYSEKRRILERINHMDMLKDVFDLEKISNSKALMDLLYFIANNINRSLSINEIAEQLGVNPRTVKRYIQILEDHYIIHEHKAFKKKLKNEVQSFSRYYFYDLGIRNSMLRMFNPLSMRNDVEELWANWLIIERHKVQELTGVSHVLDFESYFWETWQKHYIDLLEVDRRSDETSSLRAYKFGFNNILKRNQNAPSVFQKNYPTAQFTVVTPQNFKDFLTLDIVGMLPHQYSI